MLHACTSRQLASRCFTNFKRGLKRGFGLRGTLLPSSDRDTAHHDFSSEFAGISRRTWGVWSACLVGATLLLFSSTAHAQRTDGLCRKADPYRTHCLDLISRVVDSQIDFQLEQHIAKSPEEEVAIRAAQRAFKAYRETQCGMAQKAPIRSTYHACYQRLSKARLAELELPLLGGRKWHEADYRMQKVKLKALPGGGHHDFGRLPPPLTLQDRSELFGQSGHTGGPFDQSTIQRVLRKRNFGPRSAAFLSQIWNALRFDPETGLRLHPWPGIIHFGDLNRPQVTKLAETIPRCMRDLSESRCRIRYSIELGCRYEPAAAELCRRRYERMANTFAQYDRRTRSETERYYRALACLIEKTPDNPYEPNFFSRRSDMENLEDGSQAVTVGMTTGRSCRDLGLRPDGSGGFRAENVPLFGKPTTLVIPAN